MLLINEILDKYGRQIVEQIKTDIKSKSVTKFGAVNSSGNLAESVRYEVSDGVLRIYAAHYIFQIENGRRPGKFPPISAIEKWIDEKPITIQPDDKGRILPKKSLAFLIARKISRQGTEIFKQGGSNLIADILNPELLGAIRADIILSFNDATVRSISSQILKLAA